MMVWQSAANASNEVLLWK